MKQLTHLLALLPLCLALNACAVTPPPRAAGNPPADDKARLAQLERGLRPMVLQPGQAPPQWTISERMAHYKVPGVAIAILRNGEVTQVRGYGVREASTRDAVDADTLFSAGSVSKMITAATVLRLVDQQRLDLDTDVDTYLRRWHLPPAPEITRSSKPTLRMLMSHTSGLGQHGFKDYAPNLPLPTLLQTLDGLPPALNPPIRFEYEPGTRAQYSGGGTSVTQLVLEDVSGLPFAQLARSQVFDPLHLPRANFEQPLSAARGNIAKSHDDNGVLMEPVAGWKSMPELAASGLWISARELGQFNAALIRSYRSDSGFLQRRTAQDMMTEVARSGRGLGPGVEGAGHARIFHHGGSNDGYKTWTEGNLVSGDGIVILTNGSNGGDLGREIRNAAADAFGWAINPPIRTVALDYTDPRLHAYAGRYTLNAEFLRTQGVAPPPKARPLIITLDASTQRMQLGDDPDDASVLYALSPNRFVAPDLPSQALSRQLEFHRNAQGAVHAVTVDVGGARFYYTRDAVKSD